MILVGSLKPTSEEVVISDEHIPAFLSALKQDKLAISKNLIKSIYWALTLPQSKHHMKSHLDLDPLKLSRDNNQQLSKITETYLTGGSSIADDKTLSNTAREVLKICKAQLGGS